MPQLLNWVDLSLPAFQIYVAAGLCCADCRAAIVGHRENAQTMYPRRCTMLLAKTPGDGLAVRLQPELSATLPMQGYLLSCALDGSVKVLSTTENPQPNAILETSPNYSHPSTSDSGQVCTIKPFSWQVATAKQFTLPVHALLPTTHTEDYI